MSYRAEAATAAEEALLLHLRWDEYLRLEEAPGLRFEYDEGRLIVSPSGVNAHNALVQILAELLNRYADDQDERPCAVFSEHSFFMPAGRRDLRPDVGVITDERRHALDPDAWPEGAPNIAVEVLSRSTEARDRAFKAERYFEQGTAEYWLLDAKGQRAEFLRRGDAGWEPAAPEGSVYRTPLLPGFALDLSEVWRRLDRRLGRR